MNSNLYNLLNKFEAIVNSLSNFAVTAKSSEEIDNTPNKLNLPGDVGDIITKDRYLIYYKSVNSNKFVSLSAQFPVLITERKSILSSGVNRVATWTKSINGWKLTGYVTMNMDENCCIISEKNDVFITWNPIQDTIYYGTPLTDQQLNAIASYYGQNVEGTFKYTPDFNTILQGGEHVLNTVFTPTDINTYNTASKSIKITVNKVTASTEYRLIWNELTNSISYGTALSDAQLNAQALYNDNDLPGEYIYKPGFGAILSVGTDIPIECKFYPLEKQNYEVLSASNQITVKKKKITDYAYWNITYTASCGGSFDDQMLNASVGAVDTNYNIDYKIDINTSSYVGMSFPASFTKNSIHGLTASITPTNTDNYEAGDLTCSLYIQPKPYTINWSIDPASIAYGSIYTTNPYFSNIQIKDGNYTILGTSSFSYLDISTNNYISITPDVTTCSTLPGKVKLKCTFTPNETESCYDLLETTKIIDVTKNMDYQIIDFPNTQTIGYGNPIELNAHVNPSSVLGTFKYYYGTREINTNTVLDVNTYVISAVFYPTNSEYYASKSKQQTLTITQSYNYNFTWNPTYTINYGDSLVNVLNATADITGTPVVYTEGSAVYNVNSILTVGSHNITATFTPADKNYAIKTLSRTITVNQVDDYIIEWNLSSDDISTLHSFLSYDKREVNIPQWRSLVKIKYNDRINPIPGTYKFYEGSTELNTGDKLSVGTHTIKCEFIPTDTTTYATKYIERTIVVSDYSFTLKYVSDHTFNITITGYRDDINSNTGITLNDTYSVLYDASHYDVYNVIGIASNAFNDSNNISLPYITTFNINETAHTITSIGDSAFSGLSNITYIYSGSNSSIDVFEYVTTIGNNPFMGCSKLNPVNINNDNFTTTGNILYFTNSETQNYKIVCYYEKATDNSVVLDGRVYEIGTNAFSNNNTFNKNKLQVLIINNDETAITIPSTAFYNFGNLKTIYFTGYQNIISDNGVFPFTNNNFSVKNYSTVFYYNQEDGNTPNFINAANITSNAKIIGTANTIIPAPAKLSSGNYVVNTTIDFAPYNSSEYNTVTEIIIPYGYTTITGSALGNCSSLKTISLPASISEIYEKYGLCYAAPVLSNINIFPHDNTALVNCKYKVYNNQTLSYNSIQNSPRLSNILFEFVEQPGEVDTYKLICYPIGLTYDNYKLYSSNSSFYIEEVGNYAFYRVGNRNYYANSKLKNIDWNYENNTVLKRIGDYAFFETTLTFDGIDNNRVPKQVEYIGKRAFYNNTNINGVKISENLRNYGGKVCNAFTMFQNFSNLANPYAAIGEITSNYEVSCSTIPMTVEIEDRYENIVEGYTGLNFVSDDKSIYLYQADTQGSNFYTSSNIKNLVSMFMFENENITNYTLPSSTEIVSDFAAYGMHTLKTLDLSNATLLNFIGSYAFGNCRSLEYVTISPSIKKIFDGCFAGNPSLHTINFDKCKIQTIGQWSFNNDYSLKNITLNFDTQSVISVGDRIFNNCNDLRTITLTGSFPLEVSNKFTSTAFDNINNTLPVYLYFPLEWKSKTGWSDFEAILNGITNSNIITSSYNVDSNGVHYIINNNDEVEICGINDTNSAVTISAQINSKTVTTIRDYAFVNKSITSLTIPSTVTSIGKYIVSGCKNLVQFVISGTADKFNVKNNVVLYETTDNILYSYAPGATATEYTSSTVTKIRESAFDSCEYLTGIYITHDITDIEDRAFYQCSKLTRVYTDSGNNNFLSTNGTLEGNNNNSDDGILFRLNDSTNLTLLYVPQALPAHYLRIPSALSVTNGNDTTNYYVTSIATGAIERTSINIIILPATISYIAPFAFVYNNSLNTIIFTSATKPVFGQKFLQDIRSSDRRNTELYSTQWNGTINITDTTYTVNGIEYTLSDERLYIVNNITVVEDSNNEKYYIYNNKLMACTVDNINSATSIIVYNNIVNNEQTYSYNEIDDYALANRAGTQANYTIRFVSEKANTINDISALNSNIVFGSSMVNRLDFVNVPAPSYGSFRMFATSPTTLINQIGISVDYRSEWNNFMLQNGYNSDTNPYTLINL